MMKKIIRVTLSLLRILCGIGILTFDVSLFIQRQSWGTFGGMITIGGIGFMLVQLDIAVAQGRKLRNCLRCYCLLWEQGLGSGN